MRRRCVREGLTSLSAVCGALSFAAAAPPEPSDPDQDAGAAGWSSGRRLGDPIVLGVGPILRLDADEECYNAGARHVIVTVSVTDLPVSVVGAQFFLQFDAGALTLVSIEPAGSGDPDNDFDIEVFECSVVQQVPRNACRTLDNPRPDTIAYAVGIPGDRPPEDRDAALAVITFDIRGEICVPAMDLVTFLKDDRFPAQLMSSPGGEPVPPELLLDLGPIEVDQTPPTITAPDDVKVKLVEPPGCEGTVADLGAPEVSDSCTGARGPTCARDDGEPCTAPFPEGRTTVIWTVADHCGNTSSATQNVDVECLCDELPDVVCTSSRPLASGAITMDVALDGASVVPPVGLGGRGGGVLRLDPESAELSWSIWVGELSSAPIGLELHGPAAPGRNGPIQVDLGSMGVPGHTLSGSTRLSAVQARDLLAGRWYASVHTEAFPEGEIRGQVNASGEACDLIVSWDASVPAGCEATVDAVIDIGCELVPVPNGQAVNLTCVTPPPARLLDIKPGSCPNPLNRGSQGVLPVALCGAPGFDVRDVAISSLALSRADGTGGSVGPHEGPPGPHTVIDDVATPQAESGCACHELDEDGIDDVMMHFDTPGVVAALSLDDLPGGAFVELVLSGTLTDGTPFSASDCVRLVPPNGGGGGDGGGGGGGAPCTAEFVGDTLFIEAETAVLRVRVTDALGNESTCEEDLCELCAGQVHAPPPPEGQGPQAGVPGAGPIGPRALRVASGDAGPGAGTTLAMPRGFGAAARPSGSARYLAADRAGRPGGADDAGGRDASLTLIRHSGVCLADADLDGLIGPEELAALVEAWGADEAGPDVDGAGGVDARDLVALLRLWGPCPKVP